MGGQCKKCGETGLAALCLFIFRAIEEETHTFLFMVRDKTGNGHLLICAADIANRRRAESQIQSFIHEKSNTRSGRPDRGGYSNWDDWGDWADYDYYDDYDYRCAVALHERQGRSAGIA